MSFAEALRQKRPGRIHDLVLEVERHTEDDVYFDVEKEIGGEVWNGMMEEIDQRFGKIKKNRDGDIIHFLDLAANLTILRPTERHSFHIDGKEGAVLDISREGMKGIEIYNVIKYLGLSRVCGRNDDVKRSCASELWPPLVKELGEATTDKNFLWLDDVVCLFFVDQIRCKKELPVDDATWASLGREAKFQFQRFGAHVYAKWLRNLKILSPERFHTLDLHWDELYETLSHWRSVKAWADVARLAADMKIIAAKEVKITDEGVELVMPEKHSYRERMPPRPERLSF